MHSTLRSLWRFLKHKCEGLRNYLGVLKLFFRLSYKTSKFMVLKRISLYIFLIHKLIRKCFDSYRVTTILPVLYKSGSCYKMDRLPSFTKKSATKFNFFQIFFKAQTKDFLGAMYKAVYVVQVSENDSFLH